LEAFLTRVSHVIETTHLFHQSSKQVVFLILTFFLNVAEVALVFLLVEDEGLHRIIARLHAKLNALVKHSLRLIRCVHISLGQRLEERFVVVDRGIDHAVADGLRDDLLGLLDALQAELGSDVGERDL